MAENIADVKQIGPRIAYIDPNNIIPNDVMGGDHKVAETVTPNYTDFCISFNLICEMVSRYHNPVEVEGSVNGMNGDNSTRKAIISWTAKPHTLDGNKLEAENFVSFMQGDYDEHGKDNGGQTNLTTFYDQATFEEYRDKNIVEGLCVENVTVSFESYYTPTVTIKFVDVRGMSLFGREEAVHQDNGVTADTVFGCFFTIPYPKFRLQIKGFYGKAVTYQLTCSGFKGNFNAQTGNFEATVSFIGYSYSLLTDIPLQYIVSVPDCEYYGKSYWESHKDSDAWRLSDGNRPPKLLELISNIKKAQQIDVKALDGMTDEEEKQITACNDERAVLGELRFAFDKFKNAFQNNASSYVEYGDEDGNRQLVLFYQFPDNKEEGDNGNVKYSADINNEIVQTANELVEKFTKYNTQYTETAFDEATHFPNGGTGTWDLSIKIPLTRFLNFTYDMSGRKVSRIDYVDGNNAVAPHTKDTLKKIEFYGGRHLNELSAGYVYDNTDNTDPQSFGSKIFEYAYIMDLKKLDTAIAARANAITATVDRINQDVNTRHINAAQVNLGMTPSIGDVFKVLMCHLETFCAMMYECAKNISGQQVNGNRDFSRMNVDPVNTDCVLPVAKVTDKETTTNETMRKTLPPWPAIYKKGSISLSGDDTATHVLDWIGDKKYKKYKHSFEEEKLILALYKAIMWANTQLEQNQDRQTTITSVPVLPFDLALGDLFTTSSRRLDSLAGYLGLRATALLGMLENTEIPVEVAKTMGVMDAYNYINGVPSMSVIDSFIDGKLNNRSLSDVLFDIMVMKDKETVSAFGFDVTDAQSSDDKQFTYEIARSLPSEVTVLKGHHNMFYPSSNNRYTYVYQYTKPDSDADAIGHALVPSRMIPFNEYKQTYKAVSNNGKPYFVPYMSNSPFTIANTLHICKDEDLLKAADNGDGTENVGRLEEYKNRALFEVFEDEAVANGVVDRYSEMKTGTFKINGKEYSEDFSKVLDRYWHVDNSAYGEYFKGCDYFLSPRISDRKNVDKALLYPDTASGGLPRNFKKKDAFYNDKNGKSDKERKASYQPSSGKWKTDAAGEKSPDELYVEQLQVGYTEGKYTSLFGHPFYYHQNSNPKTELIDYAKALLFLQCLEYGLSGDGTLSRPYFARKNQQQGSISVLPYGVLLLYGGLLWRHRYIKKEKTDVFYTQSVHAPMLKGNTEYTILHKKSGGGAFDTLLRNPENKATGSMVTVQSLFGYDDANVRDYEPDYHITNRLIELFENFVQNEWPTIRNSAELKDSNGKNYTASTFKEDVEMFKKAWDRLPSTDMAETQPEWPGFPFKMPEKNVGEDLRSFLFGDLGKGTTDEDKIKEYMNLLTTETIFKGFFGNYSYLYPSNSAKVPCVTFIFNENAPCQSVMKDLYTRKCIVADSVRAKETSTNKNITVSGSLLRNYVDSFAKKLEELRNVQEPEKGADQYDDDPSIPKKRDILISMYVYLKSLWDKWLVAANTNSFTVTEFFDKNFYFMDAYYKNIYRDFIVNCNTFLTKFMSRMQNKDTSLFHFIGDIVSEHHCLFVGIPDLPMIGHDDIHKAVDELRSIFTPIPYEDVGDIQQTNRFVVIYVPKLAEHAANMTEFRYDGFDVWSTTEGKKSDDLPGVFEIAATSPTRYSRATRYGYNVPSFGVAFTRQNNAIFKNMSLNMETPVITSTSARALTDVAKIGSGNDHHVAFFGQDIYPVFSNYSYIIEVEMMGDAQIQPLMYFQLLNVPMWRGTYMIFNVTHTMTAGNMVTKFKGMKLASRPMPYNSEWFTVVKGDNNVGPEYESYSGGSGYAASGMHDTYERPSTKPKDHYHDDENNGNGIPRVGASVALDRLSSNGVETDPKLIDLYNELYEEIFLLPENQGNERWNVMIHSATRTIESVPDSDHKRGHALDLLVAFYDRDGKRIRSKDCKENDIQWQLYTAADILYTNHHDKIHEILIEFWDTSKGYGNGTPVKHFDTTGGGAIAMLHISTVSSAHPKYGVCQIHRNYKIPEIQGSNGRAWTAINRGQSKQYWMQSAPEPFKHIAARAYNKGESILKSEFGNYNVANMSSDELAAHFKGGNGGGSSVSNLNGAKIGNVSYVFNALRNQLGMTPEQAAGCVGNLCQESAVEPTCKELNGGNGRGIAQWTDPSRQIACANFIVGGGLITDRQTAMNKIVAGTLQQQTAFLIKELQDPAYGLSDIKTARTVFDACYKFQKNYEVAGKPAMGRRLRYSENVFSLYKGGKLS